nr:hypothetical protein [Persephonella atlantica]
MVIVTVSLYVPAYGWVGCDCCKLFTISKESMVVGAPVTVIELLKISDEVWKLEPACIVTVRM